MNNKLSLLVLLLPAFLVAQPPKEAPPFSIGDRLPTLIIPNVLNHTASSITLSGQEDKLIILDFMATNCKSCLQELPRLDSLQQQFGKELQIILVTYESKEKIAAFFSKNRMAKAISLPIITGDSILSSFFPHRFISHEVWIKGGIVKAITSPHYVDAAHIQTLLSGREVRWPVKSDKDYDQSQPLLTLNRANIPEGSSPQVVYSSSLTSRLKGVSAYYIREKQDSARGTVTTRIINGTVLDLYLRAWNLPAFFHPNHVLLEVGDSSRILFDEKEGNKDDWREDNTWCYESVLPLTMSAAGRQQKIQADLDSYLGLRGRLEKRTLPCLVLVPTGTIKKKEEKRGSGKNLVSLSNLIWRLNRMRGNPPVLDESGITEKVYLHLEEEVITNRQALVKALAPYGLTLKEVPREVELLVISDH